MALLPLPLPLPLLMLALLVAEAYAGCTVNVNNRSQMPKPQPLLLKPGGSKDVHGFIMPDASGVISLETRETIIIACPDNSLRLTGQAQATAVCIDNTAFSVDGTRYEFRDLRCRSQPTPSGQTTGSRCGSSGQYQLINLGFQVGSDFYTLIEACFDDRSYSTVYDHFTMVAQIGGRQTSFKWNHWFKSTFFGSIDMDKQYNNDTQLQTFNTLLGERGSRYIKNEKFLTRGHLSANTDFVLGAQEVATYQYVNAAPQWKKFNCGNWHTMETNVRSYAARNRVELEIYTGTHGITTLPNVNNVETELYLYADGNKYIPVPKIFWKIAYNANTKAAAVFVGVNNPYIDNPGSDYYVCPDVCSNINWITWAPRVKGKGYSYCCEYTAFKNAVPDAPDLIVTHLLT